MTVLKVECNWFCGERIGLVLGARWAEVQCEVILSRECEVVAEVGKLSGGEAPRLALSVKYMWGGRGGTLCGV